MSNQIPIVEATKIRNEDELEGTLLPAYGENDETIPLAAAAYPVEHFEYTDASLAQDQRQYQLDEHVAYPLEQNNRAAMSDDSRSRVRYAEQNGIVASEQELEGIRRTNRKVLSHDYFERLSIQEANRNARTADSLERQGRTPQMTENRPTPSEEVKKEEKKDTTASKPAAGYNVGGYEVQEYEMENYETLDYNVSEYKSVYD
jgi:hypothetical protein